MTTNTITIEGRTTGDAELRYLQNGDAVARLDVAHNTRRKNSAGEWEDGETTFVPVTCWRRLAEAVAEIRKGTPVLVTGRLRQERWEHDGQQRSRLSVVAESVAVVAMAPKRETQAANGDTGAGWDTEAPF